jgi:F-type H+-transporting ATPase subunit gamma
MSETVIGLRRKIGSAGDLRSVVRAMKALAASNIKQYDRSVRAISDYYRTVEMALGACFRAREKAAPTAARGDGNGRTDADAIGVVVFGSDQGLVGRFNEVVADEALKALGALAGKAQVWSVGERVRGRLQDAGVHSLGLFPVPTSVNIIAALSGQILVETETHHCRPDVAELHLFYNRATSGAVYGPVHQRLLPLDAAWRCKLVERAWPTNALPEVLGGGTATLRALIREYLFVLLFRACAESLASENASRLAAMERADQNIKARLETLDARFHRLRQSGIDEELFDVISGFEALSVAGNARA